MKFPYGITKFDKLITQNYIYLDRTHLMPVIESLGDTLLFLRPRRFGKSLWLSTLENYYDVNKADQFEALFGALYIGQTPTPSHNQYLILRWDFSHIDPQGSPEEIRQALHNHLNNSIKRFSLDYKAVLPEAPHINNDDAISSLENLIALTAQTPYKVYLLVDEYDNFANEVLMAMKPHSRKNYERLLYSEGALKSLFKVVKGLMATNIDRVFITGVSPIVMSDMTSGFNIAKSIYFEPALNTLCGFVEDEVAGLVATIISHCSLPPSEAQTALNFMRTFYNGYLFAEKTEPTLIYNPTLVFYFLDHLARHCRYPREVLDYNLSMDRNKITFIASLPHGEQVIDAILDETNPLQAEKIIDRFGVADMLTGEHSTGFMLSLLYYFGVITLGEGTSPLGKLNLRVPNLVTRRLYLERITEQLLPDFHSKDEGPHLAEIFYQTGNLEPLCQFMVERLFTVFDNRDYRWTNELVIKTAFMAILFNDIFYMVDSETELERTYSDLILIIRPNMRQYALLDFILEFKYLSLKNLNLSAEKVQALSDEEIIALPAVQSLLLPTEVKLKQYATRLQTHYGNILRLHARLVVALGYERIVPFSINLPK